MPASEPAPLPDGSLRLAALPAEPRAVVLLLHGGAERGVRPVDGRSLAYRRTAAMFRTLATRFADAGVATALLRFSVKGWNERGGEPSPVPDARAAIAWLHSRFPGLPIVLLGHSMGARTAARVADADGVAGVVGLAPWLPKDDPVQQLRGRHLITGHGTRDRITSPRHTRRYVERAATVTASADHVDLRGLGHYMLSGAGRWNDFAVESTLALVEVATGSADQVSDRDPDVGGITRRK